MSDRIIEIIVADNGTTQVQTRGFSGNSCWKRASSSKTLWERKPVSERRLSIFNPKGRFSDRLKKVSDVGILVLLTSPFLD